MAESELLRLVPDAPPELCQILEARRGPVEPPIRSEIFGPERFAQHGRSLALTHHAGRAAARSTAFFPRLRENVRVLREAHGYIALQAKTGYDVSPAAEWLLDNFHLIEGQLKEIHDGLPRRYFRDLPVLIDEPLAGLPRVYSVAWAFVAHTDGAFDEELLVHFLNAYQQQRELTLGELWALPTTLRVVLVENLRRLAERVATNKAAREMANLCCDRIESQTLPALDTLLTLLNRRGVGPVFLAQMAQRLQDQVAPSLLKYREWLQRALPDLASVQIQQPAAQAADNLSVSNAIGSLRLIGNADWPDIVGRTSATLQLLLASPAFEAERDDTRDQTLHAIEKLARDSERSESQVAKIIVGLMHRQPDREQPDGVGQQAAASAASHWVRGPGRPELLRLLGLHERAAVSWRAFLRRASLPAYLSSLALGTVALVAWMFLHHGARPGLAEGEHGLVLLAALLMLLPASEAVVAVVNRLVAESTRPNRLPRLALAHGIPREHRVMVVIPGMLTDKAAADALAHQLELHHLANPERHAQFALLTDWADADTASLASDDPLLSSALRHIGELNARYPAEPDAPPRFLVLHRERRFSRTEGRWIGWERKRGKIEQLVAAMTENADTAGADSEAASNFMDLGEWSRIAPDTRYIVTLDSDTQLPPGRLRELVGVAAHPHNQPRFDATGRRVVGGYGILQPRVVTPLPAPKDMTLYHWLFAGQCGIDPYSAATSEIYQDLFGEGSFSGKGLLNVQAMQATLSHRLPDGQVLSHDLLEGSLARCAAVTDITVIEDAPFHADVAASRVHRWTRGDWQLLPFLFHPRRYAMRAINRWKMLDNLRRSLVAPGSLALLVLALASHVVSPWSALALVFAAFSAGPLMGAVAGFAPSRDEVAKRHFYRLASGDLARAVCSGLWQLAQLLQLALMSADAVLRTVWRLAISRRHLLEWRTAAAAQSSVSTDLRVLAREHISVPIAAIAVFVGLLLLHTEAPLLAGLLCAIWAASPVWTWWVSRTRPARGDAALPLADQAYLHGLARDTWRLFERCVSAEDHHLPPDNLQVTPHTLLARRTSPTNIGLYLLSAACARQFGWIGTQDLLARLEATLGTLAQLPRHRGHFLNWYDTGTGAALLPMYVSTVDSGNLSGHLLAVAEACLELARTPYDDAAARRSIRASTQRMAPLGNALTELAPDGALARLLALPDPLTDAREKPVWFEGLLRGAAEELASLLPTGAETPLAQDAPQRFAWEATDHIATLRSMLRDLQAEHSTAQGDGSIQGDAMRRLQTVAATCQSLAWEADFSFLYHRKRHLFHIGYRVVDQQLDASFYDLLASESRLTSLLAIAKGDVPVSHWAALGRPFYAVGSLAGLRSWSGSMFEYLMPSLVLEEPHGSVLNDACLAALHEQIAFGREQQVPWGISESAYAASDHTLAYQYAPQGVPRLALRRTPPDELVIAPYATALAAQIAPHCAVDNLERLQTLSARARYGMIEALDYSPARQAQAERATRVDTFMAHHQGMSIVALANVLLGGAPRRWGMANAHVQAVASLLHERAPREVSVLLAPPPGLSPDTRARRAPGLLREVVPGMSAVEPTQLLSNGRYNVSLRANGAGASRWGQVGITRTRDDALRDAHGSFFYLRWDRQPQAVSVTQHPAPDPTAHYQSSYHADRVSFSAAWPELESLVTVWVSPEDDIELRRVELRNLSDRSIDLELMSAFEITLADARADEAHPAFSNLFLRAEWQAAHQALLFERRPRLPTERGLQAAHFLADHDPQITGLQVQTDRLRWLGRNRDASHPQALFGPLPVSAAGEFVGDDMERAADAASAIDTGLDPVCALAVRLQLAPHSKATLTFCTTASDNAGTLRAVIDKYRQLSSVERSSLMSATLTGIRLRELKIGAETYAAVQMMTSALVMQLTRPHAIAPTPGSTGATDGGGDGGDARAACDRRLLWRFGISGDLPIVLVTAGAEQGVGLLRSLAQALRLWSRGGVACDLVVVNAEPTSYLMTLQREVAMLQERYVAESGAQPAPTAAGFHVLRSDALSADELSTLRVLARLHLNADGRPLTHHVQEWADSHDEALERRNDTSTATVANSPGAGGTLRVPDGQFTPHGGDFRFEVNDFQRPARPWVNVLANPAFGAQLSEAGGGYTWALNSRLNQLTPWSNDPVADTPGEWFLLQDLKTRQVWSVAPSAWGDNTVVYRVAHGQGHSLISHRRGDLDVSASWAVDPVTSVKQIRLRIVNRGHRTLRLRAIGIAEWIMGANRADRGSVHTAPFSQRLAGSAVGLGNEHAAEYDTKAPADNTSARRLTALLCTQRERSAGFGSGTAFLAIAGDTDEAQDWTCDRRECFDARGRLGVPDHFSQAAGSGLDPCAALASLVTLGAGDSAERVFLLGFGTDPDAARHLATTAASVPAVQRLDDARGAWDRLLGATTVHTPDPLFDAMVNRWLLYQTVSCRLWAKAGFYQAGGAYGFRDQLQDAMALAWAAPDMLRRQIVLGASRQFPEGDVQHWWHAPTGAGVRTHFSDDLLWLPHACAHYLQTTGDNAVLDESVPFVEGMAIPPGAEDAYYAPSVSAYGASVYEHCARTIDRSLAVGAHGLPLMGTGDWNDGMNRVGHEGRGESVWLGWFLCRVVADFSPIAQARGDSDRAQRWLDAAAGWKQALRTQAWDGEWFKRAFFDDGTPLGSSANAECRIDLIAQAWAVLSGAAPEELAMKALAAMDDQLVDRSNGLIKLLTPPLAHAEPSAGYIQAYPPGVRENGGQYSHAGVWALMAQARSGDGDAAYRYFMHLSPAHRSANSAQRVAYAIEPYVMAGDVYTQAPYVGRGGWSWYTGSAAWMHRAAIESMFGLTQTAEALCFRPCLPMQWAQAEMILQQGGRALRFVFCRPHALAEIDSAERAGATALLPGQWLAWPETTSDALYLVPLSGAIERPSSVADEMPATP